MEELVHRTWSYSFLVDVVVPAPEALEGLLLFELVLPDAPASELDFDPVSADADVELSAPEVSDLAESVVELPSESVPERESLR